MTQRLLAAAAILALALLGSRAMAVEEPAFKSLVRDGAFEVRQYPALAVAEVTVPGGQKQAANRGFRLLAGYIFGGNQGGRSIAMTAPVTLAPAGGTVAITAPVTQTAAGRMEDARAWTVRFTMASRYSLSTLPPPRDARVHLREAPPVTMAVVRFSGLAEPRSVAAKTKELTAWIARRRLHPVGPASLAQYDPPWTPWFMRRNEVMIAVQR